MMDKHMYVFADRYSERMRIMYRWMIEKKVSFMEVGKYYKKVVNP